MVLVLIHISAPHSSIDFTLELNRRIFVYNDNTLELQIFLSCINAPVALPIIALNFESVPPCLSMILSRYVKLPICSISLPSSLTGYMLAAFTREEIATSSLVSSCICLCLWLLGCWQSPGLQVGILVSTGFHFFSA